MKGYWAPVRREIAAADAAAAVLETAGSAWLLAWCQETIYLSRVTAETTPPAGAAEWRLISDSAELRGGPSGMSLLWEEGGLLPDLCARLVGEPPDEHDASELAEGVRLWGRYDAALGGIVEVRIPRTLPVGLPDGLAVKGCELVMPAVLYQRRAVPCAIRYKGLVQRGEPSGE